MLRFTSPAPARGGPVDSPRLDLAQPPAALLSAVRGSRSVWRREGAGTTAGHDGGCHDGVPLPSVRSLPPVSDPPSTVDCMVLTGMTPFGPGAAQWR